MPSSGRWVVLFTGRVSPPRRRVPFCTGRKEPKSRQGVGAIGRNGVATPASMPPPLDPRYGGHIPAGFCRTSGAQNLSGCLCFLPGHWALVFPKLRWMRFHFRAWRCRAGDSWSVIGGRPKGLPYPNPEGILIPSRGGAEGESAEGREKPPWGVPLPRAGLGPAPTKGEVRFYIRRRGGCPHPPALEVAPFVGRGLPGCAAFPSSIWRAGQCPAPTKGRGASAYTVGAAHLGRPPATGFYSRSSDRPTR